MNVARGAWGRVKTLLFLSPSFFGPVLFRKISVHKGAMGPHVGPTFWWTSEQEWFIHARKGCPVANGGALLQEAGLSDTTPTTPFTGSPFCRLSAWVDSPVVWALPASAPESGFLLGPESAPLFSALTTWTNPELINHLCCSHLSCSTGIFCFSGCYYDPVPNHAGLVLCYKACPHSDPPTVPNWEPPCAWTPNSFIPSVLHSQVCHLVAREDILGLFLMFEKHSEDQGDVRCSAHL